MDSIKSEDDINERVIKTEEIFFDVKEEVCDNLEDESNDTERCKDENCKMEYEMDKTLQCNIIKEDFFGDKLCGNFICVDCSCAFDGEESLSEHIQSQHLDLMSNKNLCNVNSNVGKSYSEIPSDSEADDVCSGEESETEEASFIPHQFHETSDSDEMDERDDEIPPPPVVEQPARGWGRGMRNTTPTVLNCVKQRAPIWQSKKANEATTRNIPFTGSHYKGKQVKTPSQYFRELLTDNILSNIVNESNKYALQRDIAKPLDLDKNELEQFIGIVFMMCIVKMPDCRLYWDSEMRYEKIANVMTSKRFETIQRNLHFNDNLTRPKNCDDKLYKLRPFVDAIVEVIKKNVPTEHLSIGEQIVPFKGKSGIKQDNSKKPKKWGYKIFVLCGPEGQVYNFEIYTGDILPCPGQPDIQVSGNIVFRMLENIPRNVGHKLCCNNWFTNMNLVTTLESQGIHFLGPARSNHLPGCKMPNDSELKKKGRGSVVIQTVVKDDTEVTAVKWLDNRGVLLVSSYAGTAPMGKTSRYDRNGNTRKEIDYPDIVRIYNKSMGGVNLLDSLIALYRNPIKSKKWYHMLMFHLLDMIVIQAWNNYRRDAVLSGITNKRKHVKLRKFKFQVGYVLAYENKAKSKRWRTSTDVDELQRAKVRKCGKGAAICLPPKEMRSDKVDHFPIFGTRNRCRFPDCKMKSFLKCSKCDVYLCLQARSNCFFKFHE